MTQPATEIGGRDPIETDALVIGAGPVGLFQVFQLGLLGIHAHVVDVLPYAGGQCVELYADKPIYDIPAVQVCTGRELIDRLLQQIKPFAATLHFGQEVTVLRRQADARFLVETSKGVRFFSKTIFIAAGVGAFQPKSVNVKGLEKFNDSQLFYREPPARALTGQHVVVLGESDTALNFAIDLAQAIQRRAQSITLIHRRDSFKAETQTVARMKALCATGQMDFIACQPTNFLEENGRLRGLQIVDSDALTRIISAGVVVALMGVNAKLGPVAHWGIDLERKQVKVNTEDFATSEPGIFAVGDINTYSGKKKLILCGFHECTLAAYGAAARLFPERAIPLQYTTTSPRLHRLLGVTTTENALNVGSAI